MPADIGTWRIVDEQSVSTVLEDLDDNSTTHVRELELQVPIRELSVFSPANVPGGDVTKVRDPLVATRWRQVLVYSAQTYDQMAARARNIVKLLRRGGTIEFVPAGSTNPSLFVDFEPGSGFALFGESPEDTFRALTGRAYPSGIPIVILRQPGMREAERDPLVNKLTNGTMLLDSNRDGLPDGWTLAAGTVSIQATDEAFQISHNAAVSLVTRDYAASAGSQVAVSIEARKVSGDRTVEIRLLSQPGGTILATATVTATEWGTRYSVAGTVAGGDTGVRIEIRYTGGTNATVSRFRDSQLETGTLVASPFRVGAEPVSNDPAAAGGRILILENAGEMPAPFRFNAQMESGDTPRVEELIVALRAPDGIPGHRRISDWANEVGFAQCDANGNGWTRVLENETSSVADSEASGGNAAECSLATDPTVMKRRVRLTRTTLLDSARGYLEPVLRLKPMAASQHIVRAAWAPSLADPAPYMEEKIELDWSDATSFSYIDIPLGAVYLSEDPLHALAGLTVEIHSRRASGTAAIRFDVVSLLATDPEMGDVISLLKVPGSSEEDWLGKDLVTPTNPGGLSAGTVKNNRLRLKAVNQAGGTPPVTGLAWPVGRHKIRFKLDGNGKLDFTARVRNITDSTNVVSRSLSNRKPSFFRDQPLIIEFDSVAGKSYQPQILIDGGVDSGDYLDVLSIRHKFTPYLGANEQLRTDPERGLLEKLDSSGNVISYVALKGGVPVWVPPGRFPVTVIPREIKVHSGATHGESKLARDLTVTATHAPRRPL